MRQPRYGSSYDFSWNSRAWERVTKFRDCDCYQQRQFSTLQTSLLRRHIGLGSGRSWRPGPHHTCGGSGRSDLQDCDDKCSQFPISSKHFDKIMSQLERRRWTAYICVTSRYNVSTSIWIVDEAMISSLSLLGLLEHLYGHDLSLIRRYHTSFQRNEMARAIPWR